MKCITKICLIMAFPLMLYSCIDTGQIQIKNNTDLMMENVKWGDIVISERILTGETSIPITIKVKKKDSKSNNISFESLTDENRVYAKTKERYMLITKKTITIQINPKTQLFLNTVPK